ncbi:MAG: hypothetical protein R3F41_00130 [Gammaproteobacteria bacterium]|nr:hypothetical protein [Pseudomonadales bacterium]MCP5346283.1 hypothetical protein [Pseudomonadales bacterium]
MVDETNYWIAWAVYATASCLFLLAFWRITRFRRRRVLAACLRAIFLAVIVTPWYVSDTGSAMAPALIIVLMDAITISGEAAVRAFVPLFLAVMLALVVALVWSLIRRGWSRGHSEQAS